MICDILATVDSELIQGWRAGEVSPPSGPTAKHDFIKSRNAPAYLSSESVHGAIPPADYNGLAVQGSYAKAWLIESNVIPSGYVAVDASGGPGSLDNPVAVRHHPTEQYRGLHVIPGKGVYPLQESFFARGVGVGGHHHGRRGRSSGQADFGELAGIIAIEAPGGGRGGRARTGAHCARGEPAEQAPHGRPQAMFTT